MAFFTQMSKYRSISLLEEVKAKRMTLQWQFLSERSRSPTLFGQFAFQNRFVCGFYIELLKRQKLQNMDFYGSKATAAGWGS